MKTAAARYLFVFGVVCGSLHAQTLFVPGGTSGISTSVNGNVGIGTSQPGAKLTVAGNVYASSTVVSATSTYEGGNFQIENDSKTGATTYAWVLWNMTGPYGNGLSFWRYYANGTNAGPSVWFADTGDVGIGTTTPGARFEIFRASGGADFLRLNDGFAGGRAIAINPCITGVNNAGFEIRDVASATDRLVIDATGNVGIGTTTPDYPLSISSVTGHIFDTVGATNNGQYINIKNTGANVLIGTEGATPGALFSTGGISYASGITTANATALQLGTNNTPGLTILNGGNVGIGTTNPTQKLSVNGTVQAKEVIVQTGWSDYVFDSGYHLAPLSEVEQRIKADKHLPGIPSAKQVAEQGVSVGEMQAKLLAKIEEVTLHLIAQEKKIEELQSENAELHRQMTAIKQAQ